MPCTATVRRPTTRSLRRWWPTCGPPPCTPPRDAFDELARRSQPRSSRSSLRGWPADFPVDLAVLRRVPYESRADSVMYRQVMAELAAARGWTVQLYEAKDVEAEAARLLGERAYQVLHGRARPWVHRGPRITARPWPRRYRSLTVEEPGRPVADLIASGHDGRRQRVHDTQ